MFQQIQAYNQLHLSIEIRDNIQTHLKLTIKILFYSDTMYYAAVNSVTSFLSGFVIFPVLGFMALQNGLEIKDVAASGTYNSSPIWTRIRS